MPDIVVLAAHPQLEHSRVNRALMQARRARRAPARVEVRDLYALYPDYLIDVAAEQAALADAQLMVWLHPIHWYGMPPLMKLWLDEVLRLRLGLRPGRRRPAGQGPVAGGLHRRAGGVVPPDGYNRYFFDAFLPPYEQTAALSGMRFLPPLLLHGAHRAGDAELDGARRRSSRSAWRSYPDWPEIAELDALRALRRARATPGPRPAGLSMEHGTQLAADQPGLPGRGGDRRAAGAAARAWARSSATWRPASPSGPGAWGWSPTRRTSCTSPSSAWC